MLFCFLSLVHSGTPPFFLRPLQARYPIRSARKKQKAGLKEETNNLTCWDLLVTRSDLGRKFSIPKTSFFLPAFTCYPTRWHPSLLTPVAHSSPQHPQHSGRFPNLPSSAPGGSASSGIGHKRNNTRCVCVCVWAGGAVRVFDRRVVDCLSYIAKILPGGMHATLSVTPQPTLQRGRKLVGGGGAIGPR